MSEVDDRPDDPKIGARVHVFNADRTEDLGVGSYQGSVRIADIVEDAADWGDMTTPKFVLASGQVIYGFQCWWSILDDEPATLN